MGRKIAIKRLTASDLTLFEWHFRNENAGNQKAINLNGDVFVDRLYPALPELTEGLGGRIPIDLSIYGPGIKGLHNLQRKIIKKGAYKNWRLDGEFIHNPIDDTDRFDCLAPGDLALMEFIGAGVPNAMRLTLIAATVADDRSLHANIGKYLSDLRMATITAVDLGRLIADSQLPASHPALGLTVDFDLEDAALGGSEGRRRLYARGTRKTTAAELAERRRLAEETGRAGEYCVNEHLHKLLRAGELVTVDWVSQDNAVAPYDFKIETLEGRTTLIDVKSTSWEFERPVHISFNEILQIANGDAQYDLYRVYDLNDAGGRLRIAVDVREFGKKLLKIVEDLPDGVTPDGFSVKSNCLKFGDDIELFLDGSDES